MCMCTHTYQTHTPYLSHQGLFLAAQQMKPLQGPQKQKMNAQQHESLVVIQCRFL
jgi:hypothetical protein